jgi:hypothetical protein
MFIFLYDGIDCFRTVNNNKCIPFSLHRRKADDAANEGPVRIQYKCLVPIYVFPEIKLLFPKQNYNILSPNTYTLIYL